LLQLVYDIKLSFGFVHSVRAGLQGSVPTILSIHLNSVGAGSVSAQKSPVTSDATVSLQSPHPVSETPLFPKEEI